MIGTLNDGRVIVADSTLNTNTTATNYFDPDSCSTVLGYNGTGQLITITATDPITGNVYVQTLTYTGSSVATISAWVKQ